MAHYKSRPDLKISTSLTNPVYKIHTPPQRQLGQQMPVQISTWKHTHPLMVSPQQLCRAWDSLSRQVNWPRLAAEVQINGLHDFEHFFREIIYNHLDTMVNSSGYTNIIRSEPPHERRRGRQRHRKMILEDSEMGLATESPVRKVQEWLDMEEDGENTEDEEDEEEDREDEDADGDDDGEGDYNKDRECQIDAFASDSSESEDELSDDSGDLEMQDSGYKTGTESDAEMGDVFWLDTDGETISEKSWGDLPWQPSENDL